MIVKRIALFPIGFFVGYLFDLIPSLFELIANTNVCVESCPSTLRLSSLTIYALMPIVWATVISSAYRTRQPARIISTLAFLSAFVMAALTWILYAHQHPG